MTDAITVLGTRHHRQQAGRGRLLALCLVAGLGLATMVVPPDGLAETPDEGEPDDHSRRGMTGERLGELVQRLDAEAEGQGSAWQFRVQGRPVMLVFDENADRMRIMSVIGPADALSGPLMLRMLQANLDSALDVRYAVGNGLVWSAFMHPLSPLSEAQLASAISQVVVAAETFGTTFSSGAMVYGGGDSQEHFEALERALRDRLGPSI